MHPNAPALRQSSAAVRRERRGTTPTIRVLDLKHRRALVGAKPKLLTVMIDEGSLERLTVGVQRAVERDRAFRSVDRHRDLLAAKCEHTDRQRVPALHRRSSGKLLAAGTTRYAPRAVPFPSSGSLLDRRAAATIGGG